MKNIKIETKEIEKKLKQDKRLDKIYNKKMKKKYQEIKKVKTIHIKKSQEKYFDNQQVVMQWLYDQWPNRR